jgi:ribosomal RNA-processing protein 8
MTESVSKDSLRSLSRKGKKRKAYEEKEARKKMRKEQNEARKDQDHAAGVSPSRNTLTLDSASWSKSKKKRMRAVKAKQNKNSLDTDETTGKSSVNKPALIDETKKVSKSPNVSAFPTQDSDTKSSPSRAQQSSSSSSSLAQSFQVRLQGSRFRLLNEQLYTTHSKQAFQEFSSQPKLFHEYHAGFASQVKNWPVQPVNLVLEDLKRMVKEGNQRAHQDDKSKKVHQVVVADFGCGDAKLARELLQVKDDKTESCPFIVHSFDLVASCELVTACDMSKTPLQAGTVDVAVFCLSLMGTNLADFIKEAHRVLKTTGKVKIVEVRSRFETNESKDTGSANQSKKCGKNKKAKSDDAKPVSELKRFLDTLDHLGFECANLDRSNKMFLVMDLRKNSKVPDTTVEFTAKPCIYKRR